MRNALRRMVTNFQFAGEFADLEHDLAMVEARLNALPGNEKQEANYQLQVLSSPFLRNKGAYLIGKLVNGSQSYGFVIPVLHNRRGALFIDALLTDPSQITLLFSFTRAYFMVDMEVPSAYVNFLHNIMPSKPRGEIYTILGLQKQGKAAFYRDFLHHLAHSSDNFAIAPGIRGLVMVVFALPSFPYVFKVIKDHFPAPKETTRELVKEKYLLVKYHDRVGRMADTLEYSNVAFPRARFPDELLDELKDVAPSLIEEENDQVIVRHLYIERRMTPLNIWLTEAEAAGDDAKMEHGVREYGNAIKDLVAANIFPGDMLYKNFGVTRQGRVVFYDYDEIEYITDCNFRDIPAPRNEEDEMASEPWYSVAKNDVFPEQFSVFLLGNLKVRHYFMKYHADLLSADYWRQKKARILEGQVEDVFPYPQEIRFIHQQGAGAPTA